MLAAFLGESLDGAGGVILALSTSYFGRLVSCTCGRVPLRLSRHPPPPTSPPFPQSRA